MKKFIGIEGGGTKFNIVWGDQEGNILDQIRIPTSTPEITMEQVINFIKDKSFDAIGVGVFGPVELDVESPDYGTILKTPKKEWQFFNLYKFLKTHFSCPIIIESDVNAALLGEIKWGAAQNLQHAVYFTVGTGIGAGLWLNNQFYHGKLHSEAGHMHIPKAPNDLGVGGNCPFHGDLCLEGLASGPAIEKRYGIKAENIPDDSPILDFIAYYLATACVNTVLCFAPERIIFGGGVINQKTLIHKTRQQYLNILAGYGQKPIFLDVEKYIVHAALKDNAGVLGSLALAFTPPSEK